MNCEQVITLLADYRDGAITESERAAVAEHLTGCAACREELLFLKKYRKAIEEYPTLQAPDDFLKKIHNGIEARKSGGVVRTLFFPLRIKVPLEAAALLALALTGVLLFKPFKPGMLEYSAEQPQAVIAENTAEDADSEKNIARREKQSISAKKNNGVPETKRDEFIVTPHEGMTVTAGAPPEDTAKEKRTPGDGKTEITLTMRLNALPEEAAAPYDTLAEEKREPARKDSESRDSNRTGVYRAQKAVTPGQGPDGIDGLDNLARSLDGKIIQQADGDRTGPARFMVVEIPAKNFTQFMNGLRGRWSVLNQSPAEFQRRSGTVRINMHIRQ